jgi:DNA polymerase elongation subunit (family B)
MQKFYTSVLSLGNNILYSGYENLEKVYKKIPYEPSVFIRHRDKEGWLEHDSSKSSSKTYRSLYGDKLTRKKFNSIADQKDYLKNFEDAQDVFGMTDVKYAFLADEFPKEVSYDIKLIHTFMIDIECCVGDSGFPSVHKTDQEINAITIYSSKYQKYFVFTVDTYGQWDKEEFLKSYSVEIEHIRCLNEKELLMEFLAVWTRDYPDVISGWNTKGFDIPYIVNRITRVCGEENARRLSPWKKINESSGKDRFGNDSLEYHILGISHLDYLDLYKKFRLKNRASYKLDNICQIELGEGKLSYEEYDSIHHFYKSDYSKFISYNVVDVILLHRLEEKFRYLELVFTIAYFSRINFEDVSSPVKTWDILIFNYLKAQGKVIPPKKRNAKSYQFEGAYVKEPFAGVHEWIISFDLASLYPHLIMQYLISPENILSERIEINSISDLINKKRDNSSLKHIMTANGCLYDRNPEAILPKLMKELYVQRNHYKKLMKESQKKYQEDNNNAHINDIAKFNSFQHAIKILLNSGFGAVGNEYFRYFDVRNAEAITVSGQLSIRWIERKINELMNNLCKTTDKDYIIASDTDSLILRLEEYANLKASHLDNIQKLNFIDRLGTHIFQPYITKSFHELHVYMNSYENMMDMKREIIADKVFWKAKKKYVAHVLDSEGVRYKEPEMKIMGLESVSSKFPIMIAGFLEHTYKIIVTSPRETLKEDLISYMDFVEKEFKKLPIEEISFASSVNGVDKYSDRESIYSKGTPIHVRGALLYNHYVKKNKLEGKYPLIRNGDKVKYTYLKLPNPIKEDVIAYSTSFPEEIIPKKYVNYGLQYHKAYESSVTELLTILGFSAGSSLEDFF